MTRNPNWFTLVILIYVFKKRTERTLYKMVSFLFTLKCMVLFCKFYNIFLHARCNFGYRFIQCRPGNMLKKTAQGCVIRWLKTMQLVVLGRVSSWGGRDDAGAGGYSSVFTLRVKQWEKKISTRKSIIIKNHILIEAGCQMTSRLLWRLTDLTSIFIM